MSDTDFYIELCNDIFTHHEFLDDYNSLVINDIKNPHILLKNIVYKRLLESAAILSCSKEDNHKRVALQIASITLKNSDINELFRNAAELIIIRLGIFPTLKMSIEEYGNKDYFNILDPLQKNKLTPALEAEISGKLITNTFDMDNETVLLTDFQKDILSYLRNKNNISISAPASAGKSFISMRFVVEQLKNNDKFIVIFIVPTRALIYQTQRDISKLLKDNSLESIEIHVNSNKVLNSKERSKKAIFILTQERLQYIASKTEMSNIDLLIVDEAQKIEDGARGIILEEVLQHIVDINKNIQLVFISPFINNPDKLGTVFHCKNLKPHKTCFSPVSQKIFFINFKNKKAIQDYYSREMGCITNIRTRELDEKVTKVADKKALIANNFAIGDSTIVFCNGHADCIKTAKAILKEKGYKTNIASEVNDVQ